MDQVLYIINPASNGGAGIKAWEAFKSAWAYPIDPTQVVFTDSPGHVREIVTTFNGYEIIAAVGGDGTVGEVITGIMDGPEPRPKLAVIPCGTGNDVAQNACIFSVDDAAAALRESAPRAFDLIRVDSGSEHRYAFLFGNTGFTSIPKMRPWMKRLLGATGAYNLATLLQVLVYRHPYMTVRVDGREFSGKTFMVIAGNAERAGGGCMRISPGASTNDGELNITIIESVSVFYVLTKLFPSIAQGTHINEPGVSYITGREIKVHSASRRPCWISMASFSAPPRPPFPSARWRWKSSVCKGAPDKRRQRRSGLPGIGNPSSCCEMEQAVFDGNAFIYCSFPRHSSLGVIL